MCKTFNISKSAYYAFVAGESYQTSIDKQILLNEVKTIFDNHKKRYGSRRIREELRDQGYVIGKYRVSSLMKEQGLVAIQPKSFVPKTTQSHPHLKRCPNLLLNPNNLPSEPNEVIVGDITYFPSVFNGLEDAQSKVFEYIEGYYNTVRKHSSIGYLSPNQFEERYWTDFYSDKIDTND